MEEEKSVFLEFFGDAPMFKIIDFLFEHRLEDFTKTEIAKGADISWATLFNYWNELEKHKMVKVTRIVGRARLYQLNEGEPIVKALKKMELELMKQAADEAEEEAKAVATVKARK